jgi:hypothetical protein
MNSPQNREQLAQLRAEVAVIEDAMRLAARDALLAHKRAGLPVVIWQDGKAVWVPAEQIPLDDAPSSR